MGKLGVSLMPSLFRANVGLTQRAYEFHKLHPGGLSRICQAAVDLEIALESLPERERDKAADEAAQAFWDRYSLEGAYAICNDRVIRHEATEEQMAADAKAFGIEEKQLIALLDDLFGLELEAALRRRLIIRSAKI